MISAAVMISWLLQARSSLRILSNTQHAQGASGEGNPNSIGGFITSFVKLARKCKFSDIDIQYEDIKLSCSLWGDAGIKVRALRTKCISEVPSS
ncbi:unnamed protein product [Sphagnum troendelagicum]